MVVDFMGTRLGSTREAVGMSAGIGRNPAVGIEGEGMANALQSHEREAYGVHEAEWIVALPSGIRSTHVAAKK